MPAVHVLRHDLQLKPPAQLLLVLERDRAKSEEGADLLAIALAAATLEAVIEPSGRQDRELLSDEGEDGAGNVAVVSAKTGR